MIDSTTSPDLLWDQLFHFPEQWMIWSLRADRDSHLVILRFHVQALLLQVLEDGISDMESLHPLDCQLWLGRRPGTTADLVRPRILVIRPIVIHQADKLEVVPHTTLEIVGIVRRGNLDGTSPKAHVDGDRVGDDGYTTVEEGVDDELAVEMGIAGVVRVDSDGCVAEHGLGTGGGDDELFVYGVNWSSDAGRRENIPEFSTG
jgi:hypothetical protein